MLNCSFTELYEIFFMKKTSQGQKSLRQNYFKLHY